MCNYRKFHSITRFLFMNQDNIVITIKSIFDYSSMVHIYTVFNFRLARIIIWIIIIWCRLRCNAERVWERWRQYCYQEYRPLHLVYDRCTGSPLHYTIYDRGYIHVPGRKAEREKEGELGEQRHYTNRYICLFYRQDFKILKANSNFRRR